MPSACSEDPLETDAIARSWEEPTVAHEATAQSTDTQGNLVGVNSCSALEFEPSLTLRPDVGTAESPTGVHVELSVPQHEGLEETATSTLKDTTVRFPAGLAVNPAAADGLSACTPAQIGM
jgi:hypothetical protein